MKTKQIKEKCKSSSNKKFKHLPLLKTTKLKRKSAASNKLMAVINCLSRTVTQTSTSCSKSKRNLRCQLEQSFRTSTICFSLPNSLRLSFVLPSLTITRETKVIISHLELKTYLRRTVITSHGRPCLQKNRSPNSSGLPKLLKIFLLNVTMLCA